MLAKRTSVASSGASQVSLTTSYPCSVHAHGVIAPALTARPGRAGQAGHMKTLIKLAGLGALVAVAVNIYRRQQRFDRELPGNHRQRRSRDAGNADMVADTNMISGGDYEREQRDPQPQDWRGVQNVLE
jgi:hypothetical protein